MGDENMDLPLLHDLAQVGRNVVSARAKTRSSTSGRNPCFGTSNSGNVPPTDEAAMDELCGDWSTHPIKTSLASSRTRSGASGTTTGTAMDATASTTLPDSYFVLLELSRIGVRERNREPRGGAAIHPKSIESSVSLHSRASPVGFSATTLTNPPAPGRTSSDNETADGAESIQMADTTETKKKDTDGGDGAGGTRVKCRPRTTSDDSKSGEGK